MIYLSFVSTDLKYLGNNIPFMPSVKITLLLLLKNYIPSFIANSRSIKINILQLERIPDITYYSPGIPAAK